MTSRDWQPISKHILNHIIIPWKQSLTKIKATCFPQLKNEGRGSCCGTAGYESDGSGLSHWGDKGLIPSPLQWEKGSGIAAAVTQIQSLVSQLPRATSVSKKKKRFQIDVFMWNHSSTVLWDKKEYKNANIMDLGYVHRFAWYTFLLMSFWWIIKREVICLTFFSSLV